MIFRVVFCWSADIEAKDADEAYEIAAEMFSEDLDFAVKYNDISSFGYDIEPLDHGDE